MSHLISSSCSEDNAHSLSLSSLDQCSDPLILLPVTSCEKHKITFSTCLDVSAHVNGLFEKDSCLFSKASVEDVRAKNLICILDVDIQGVKRIKETDLNPIYISIQPPSMEVLVNPFIVINQQHFLHF